jgi:ATP-dependent helicase HrpB
MICSPISMSNSSAWAEAVSRSPTLPIDALLDEIVAALHASQNLVLEAAPGAGKTTRVPPALLSHVSGEILVLEPRRIAARMAARRVALELGEPLGQTVGYQVRFERVESSATRLRFLTEGVLTRRMLSDRDLRGVSLVVLDEFHERHLETDLALALLRRLQRTARPDLKLLVMSATLDTASVAAFLGGCPVLRSEGRLFPLEVRHLPYSPAALEQQVTNAVESSVRQTTGHALVFLPGAAEIRRAIMACEPAARRFDLELLPLYGDLPAAAQDRALEPSAKRKVIFATNIAESSITVEGVTTVIDSGLARIARTSPWTGLSTLEVARISQASARQRAGRAGRTRPGLVLRLYPEEDFRQRPPHDVPEILRGDLSQATLALRVLGLASFDALDWLDQPPRAAIEAATNLLDRIGANGGDAAALAKLPLPPRLARVLLEAERRNVLYGACVAVALLSAGDAAADLMAALDKGITTLQSQSILAQLMRITRATKSAWDEDTLLQCLLCGFPDRVARVRDAKLLQLANGVTAEVTGEAPPYPFLLALDAEDRSEKPFPQVRVYARTEPDWLLDLFPQDLREATALMWNQDAERVDEVSTLSYGAITLSESQRAPSEPAAAASMLTERALEAGLARFIDPEALEQTLARIEFAGLAPPALALALGDLCLGLRSFAELRSAASTELLPMLERRCGGRLQELAPISLRLQAGKTAKIHYERGKPPWVASRLQDFFGMTEAPRIGPHRAQVVLHLLAPNQRAVQTTTDLAGFWERLYPTVRRELMRRYPRHRWPENPR